MRRLKLSGWMLATMLAMLAVCAPVAHAQQREPVPKQIDVPHPYYYREMYLPQLTSGPSSVAWTPDSKSVVYSMQGWVWRQALDSQAAQQITSGPGYDYQPDCSPDGKWILFTKYYQDALELHALEAASGRVTQLTVGGNVNLDARFSPDGRRIVFVSTAYNRRFHIFVADFAEGMLRNIQRLTGETRSPEASGPRYYYGAFDHEISPAWSPDGREIIFISNRGRLYGTGGIWRMRAEAGAEPREIYFEETTWKARPDWSPDGKRVVFSSYAGRQWHQLWVTTAEPGGYPFPISYGEYDNTAAQWSPDGERIAFISNRGGNTSLWIQEAVGGGQRELAPRERKYALPMRLLKIHVVDAQDRPVAARVSVRTGDAPGDRAFAPDNAWIHADDSFDRQAQAFERFYFHVNGSAQLSVPLKKVTVDVKRGPETRIEIVDAEPRPNRIVLVKLRPVAAPNFAGATSQWASGDVHVHMNYGGAYRNSPANLARQADAEGLRVVNNLIVNKEQRVPDVTYFTGKLDAASNARVLLWHGQEFHTSSWGHTGLLGLQKNLLLPDYAWYPQTAAASLYPSNDVVSDLARAQGGVVGYVHPFDAPPPDPAKNEPLRNTLPVDVALGKVDYLEVLGFSDHRATAEVWYRLLNCGFRVAAAGGTDAMMNFASLRGPIGLNRVYVRVPVGPLKMQEWLAGLKRGRTFATNGPLLDFSLSGKMIGDELKLPAYAREIPMRAAVRSFVPVDHAEIVCNSRVVQRVELRTQHGVTSGEARGRIPVKSSGWCVLRAWSDSSHPDVLDAYPYATTSPIYISVGPERSGRSPEDAAYFVKWIDRVREFAEAHKDWNTPAEREHVMKQIAAARAVFERQLK